MAQELDSLGLAWTDEVFLREAVAAEVTATSSIEAIGDDELVRSAWKDLQRAEAEVAALAAVSETMTKARFDFLMKKHTMEVEAKADALLRVQQAAAENHRRRVRAALASAAPEAAPQPRSTSDVVVKTEHATNTPARAPPPKPALPRVLVRPKDVNPAHVRVSRETAAAQGYRGGEVLPTANRVLPQGADVAARARVADDGDASLFVARQDDRKRQRAEHGEVAEESVRVTERAQCLRETWEKLLEYQREGVRWLLGLHVKRVGGILGDEMGLGKTVQIAALLSALAHSNMLRGPALVVAPLTVLSQWVAELHKWAPNLRTVLFHASGTNRASKEALMASVRTSTSVVVVTTYMGMVNSLELLHATNFEYVILDEGHKISNPTASITIAAKTLVTPHRLILSGSPIQNSLKELWCLFDFVVPGLLGNVTNFVDTFEEPIRASRNPKATPLQLATAVECAKALRAHIAPYLLRRLKKDVNAMLPPKHERVIRCALTKTQLELYVKVLQSPEVQQLLIRAQRIKLELGSIDRNGRAADGGLVSNVRNGLLSEGMYHQGFRVLSQLRLLTNHADLYSLKEEDQAEGGTGRLSFRSNLPVNYEGSGKLLALRRLLAQWHRNGHKVLLFSQFRMMLDIIENVVDQEGYKYLRMDGTTASKDRGALINTFNEDPTVFAALLTTRVGGLGVNLTGADRVVIFDPDWNPVTDEQARERAWRIGQTREVCVYRMITSGTIEEHILHRQLAKNFVTEKVLKDPTLQRFFSLSSFTEAFMLGPEYKEQLPPSLWSTVAGDTMRLGHEVEDELRRETLEAELEPAEVKPEPKDEDETGGDILHDVLQAAASGPVEPLTASLARLAANEFLGHALR